MTTATRWLTPPDAAPLAERPTRVHRGQIDGPPEDGDSLFNVDR